MSEYPTFSAIMPTFNRAEVVARTLAHLAAQRYPMDRLEIIVVDNSHDDTPDRVAAAASEFATRGGPRVVLRSRTPDGVRQEAWGYLCVHYAIRALIHTAARDGDHDPDRLSFTRALHATRRSVRTGLRDGITLAVALRRAVTEILHGLLPPRRARANARVVRRKMSNYQVKRAQHRSWPQPALPVTAAIHILGPP